MKYNFNEARIFVFENYTDILTSASESGDGCVFWCPFGGRLFDYCMQDFERGGVFFNGWIDNTKTTARNIDKWISWEITNNRHQKKRLYTDGVPLPTFEQAQRLKAANIDLYQINTDGATGSADYEIIGG